MAALQGYETIVEMILAGDAGGTKTILGLFQRKGGGLRLCRQSTYPSRSFDSLGAVMADFLQDGELTEIEAAGFGVAGPVVDGHCRTTNLPWEIDAVALGAQLNTPFTGLWNDLEAAAFGMLSLQQDEFMVLQPGDPAARGNIAVIAAGTGLGEALLYWDGGRYHPIATEGGHCDFAPANRRQASLLEWARERYPDHVSVERLLSGAGLRLLYEYLQATGFAPEPARMSHLPADADRSAAISEGAIIHKEPLCLEALRLFVDIYGGEAGNLALKSLASGGVVIGGGIAPRILSELWTGRFIQAFTRKGRFGRMLEAMPVRVALNTHAVLLGAAHLAAGNR